MSQNPSVNEPPTSPDPAEEQRFRQWFDRYVKEHESSPPTNSSISQGQGSQPQQTSTLEQAIETVMNRREARQQRDKRVNDLERSNDDLKGQVAELKKQVEGLGKAAKKSVFSLFV